MKDIWDRFAWLLFALCAVFVILILAGVIVKAEDKDPDRTVLCAMLARELVRVEIETASTFTPVIVSEVLHFEQAPDASLREVTPEAALKRYAEQMKACEAIPDFLPSLPKVDAAGNASWARAVVTLATRLDGVAPASEGREGWAEACAAEYRTWDNATGTVIRRGRPERVRCPLILVGEEWIVPDD
jgi:hypothetical protein